MKEHKKTNPVLSLHFFVSLKGVRHSFTAHSLPFNLNSTLNLSMNEKEKKEMKEESRHFSKFGTFHFISCRPFHLISKWLHYISSGLLSGEEILLPSHHSILGILFFISWASFLLASLLAGPFSRSGFFLWFIFFLF